MTDRPALATATRFDAPFKYLDLRAILDRVAGDALKSSVEAIRAAVAAGDDAEVLKLKKRLPVFCGSTFRNGKRRAEHFERADYIVLDLDHIDAPEALRDAFKDSANPVLAAASGAFVSPSGSGLKIVFRLSEPITTVPAYRAAWSELAAETALALGIPRSKIDEATKDVTRLCFFSHDPELFVADDLDVAFEVPDIDATSTYLSSVEYPTPKLDAAHVELLVAASAYVRTRHYYDFMRACFSAYAVGRAVGDRVYDELLKPHPIEGGRKHLLDASPATLAKLEGARDKHKRDFATTNGAVQPEELLARAVEGGFDVRAYCKANGLGAPSATRVAFPTMGRKRALVEAMNQRYYGVGDGGDFSIVVVDRNTFGREVVSSSGERVRVMTQRAAGMRYFKQASFERLLHKYKFRYVNALGEWKSEAIGKLWVNSPYRRQYDRQVYRPNQKTELPGNLLNLWAGWNLDPALRFSTPTTYAAPILGYLREVIAGGSDEGFDWLMHWLAALLYCDDQSKRPKAVCVLKGTKGTGKSFLGELLRSLLGPYCFVEPGDPERIFGRFNDHLMSVSLVFGDEIGLGFSPQKREKLKSISVSDTFSVERKNVPICTVENWLSFMVATNAEWAADVTDDNRRFMVYEVSEAHQGDRKYFGDLEYVWETGGKEAFYRLLAEYDWQNFTFSTLPIESEVLADQLGESEKFTLGGWFAAVLADGAVVTGIETTDRTTERLDLVDGAIFENSKLYSAFGHYLEKLHQTRQLPSRASFLKQFSTFVRKNFETSIERSRTKAARFYQLTSLDALYASAWYQKRFPGSGRPEPAVLPGNVVPINRKATRIESDFADDDEADQF